MQREGHRHDQRLAVRQQPAHRGAGRGLAPGHRRGPQGHRRGRQLLRVAAVLEHIAKPAIRRAAFDDPCAAGLRELARRENVSCKVSGMVNEVRDSDWNVDLLRPSFEVVLKAFGPPRIMFGSDWPVCLLRAGYDAWLAAAAELVAPLGADEQAAFWSRNARRIYRLPSSPDPAPQHHA